MPNMRILLDEESVNEYITKEGLEFGFVALDVALLQASGTINGKPCVMLVGTTIKGEKLVLKITLDMLETVAHACRGRMDYLHTEMAEKGSRN